MQHTKHQPYTESHTANILDVQQQQCFKNFKLAEITAVNVAILKLCPAALHWRQTLSENLQSPTYYCSVAQQGTHHEVTMRSGNLKKVFKNLMMAGLVSVLNSVNRAVTDVADNL